MKYPETVDVIISVSKDPKQAHKDCRLYDNKGNALGFAQQVLNNDIFATTFSAKINIKDIIKYIKSQGAE